MLHDPHPNRLLPLLVLLFLLAQKHGDSFNTVPHSRSCKSKNFAPIHLQKLVAGAVYGKLYESSYSVVKCRKSGFGTLAHGNNNLLVGYV